MAFQEYPLRIHYGLWRGIGQSQLDEAYRRYSEMGFNIVLDGLFHLRTQEYRDEELAAAVKYDMKIMANAHIDPAVRAIFCPPYADETAIWGWLLWDEPARNDFPLSTYQEFYDEIKGYCPNHKMFYIYCDPQYTNDPDVYRNLGPGMCDVFAYERAYPFCTEEDPYGATVATASLYNWQIWYARDPNGPCNYDFLPCVQAFGCTSYPYGGTIPDAHGQYHSYLEVFTRPELSPPWPLPEGVCCYSGGFGEPLNNSELEKNIFDLHVGTGHFQVNASWRIERNPLGSLAFEKSLAMDRKERDVHKLVGGTLTMTKAMSKDVSYPLAGNISPAGVLKKLLSSFLSGSMNLLGDLDTPYWETIKKNVSGSLTFASTLTDKIVKKLLGLISYGKYKYSDLNNLLWSQLETLTWDQLQSFDAGSLTKKVKLALAGGMADGFAPRGYIMGKTPSLRACEKTWSFIQTLTWTQFQEYFWCKHILYVRSLGGGVGMSGTPGRHLEKPLSGSFGFNPTENLFMKVKPVLSSALSLAGVAKRLIHFLTTGVSNLTGSPKIKALLTASGGINLYGKVSTGVGALRKLLYKLIQLIERRGV